MMSASQTIRKIRLELCLEQEELANLVGLSKSSISNYETGKSIPRLKIIRKFKELAEKNDIKVKVEDFLD